MLAVCCCLNFNSCFLFYSADLKYDTAYKHLHRCCPGYCAVCDVEWREGCGVVYTVYTERYYQYTLFFEGAGSSAGVNWINIQLFSFVTVH